MSSCSLINLLPGHVDPQGALGTSPGASVRSGTGYTYPPSYPRRRQTADGHVQAHCDDDVAFVNTESLRRQINANEAGREKFFVSHSWRNPATQYRKRRILAHLSTPVQEGGPGLVYWADFLDLQAEGPVPWKKEIEEGIAACSKFVMLLDRAWLTSYNCLQELVMAIQNGKPLVILVLDHEGWDFLTVPGGAEKAKAEADGNRTLDPDGLWVDNQYGAPLCSYNGEEIVSGQEMSLAVFKELFARLASINLCPCRPLEEENKGYRGLLAIAAEYVTKNLHYYKEHAQLKNKADAWEQAVREGGPQPFLQKDEAVYWRRWVDGSQKYGREPLPTELMERYVDASLKHSQRKQTGTRTLALILLLVLVGGATASTLMAVRAQAAEERATAALIVAQKAQQTAEVEAKKAQAALIQAQASDAKATAALQVAIAAELKAEAEAVKAVLSSRTSTALASVSVMNKADHASEWEVKLLREALVRLPTSDSAAANITLLNAGQKLLKKPICGTIQVLATGAEVSSVAWSPDGSRLASAGGDGVIHLWGDAGNGAVADSPLQTLQGHTNLVQSLSWSPDGTLLASGSRDLTIRLWTADTDSGMLGAASSMILEGHSDWIWSVAFSPTGTHLASASQDHSIRLWLVEDLTAGPQVLHGHSSWVLTLSWAPDGTRFVSGSADSTVQIWSIGKDGAVQPDSQQVLQSSGSLMAPAGRITAVAWSPSGLLLASASVDLTVKVWAILPNGTVDTTPQQVLEGHSDSVSALAWAPSGAKLLSASYDSSVRVWQVTPGGQVESLMSQVLLGHEGPISSLSYIPNKQGFASSSSDTTVRLWAPKVSGLGDSSVLQALEGHSDWVWSVAWSGDGSKLASGAADNTVVVWPADSSGAFNAAAPQTLRGHSDIVFAVAWSPDSSRLVSGSRDSSLRVWVLPPDGGSSLQQVLKGHTESVQAVAYSPDGSRIASASMDTTVRVWTVNDANWVQADGYPEVLDGHASWVWTVAFSPDGSMLASGSADLTARVWRMTEDGFFGVESPQVLADHDGWVWSLAWAPDGTVLATSSDSYIRLWGVLAGVGSVASEPKILNGHASWVSSLAWSPDGAMLASSSNDKTVKVWPASATSSSIGSISPQVLEGHSGMVQAVAWGPDSTRLASAGGDSVHVSSLLSVCSMVAALDQVPILNWTMSHSELLNNIVPPPLFDFAPASLAELCQ